MKKYLLLLITIMFLTPCSVLAVTDLSQKDFDQAKEGNNSKGIAFSKEYNNYYFEVDGEYRLITDITLTNSIVVNEADPELILDLNGKTLKLNTSLDDNNWFISVYASKLTIKGNGYIKSNSNMKYLLIGLEGSNIIIDNCNIAGRSAVDGEEKRVNLTIKSGSIGSLSMVDADVVIDNAIINSNALKREAIYVNTGVNLTINSGTFESEYGALKSISEPDDYNRSNITINGGTYKGKEKYGLILDGHEKLIVNGGIFIDNNDTVAISKDDKKGVEKLINAGIVAGTVEITKGENSKYKEGVNKDLSFTVDKEYSSFVYDGVIYGKFYVDDKLLDNNDFSLSDNTTITLNKEYLNKLSKGTHTIKIVSYDNDFASTKFIVIKKSNPIIYISVVCLCLVVLAGVVIYLNKKKD